MSRLPIASLALIASFVPTAAISAETMHLHTVQNDGRAALRNVANRIPVTSVRNVSNVGMFDVAQDWLMQATGVQTSEELSYRSGETIFFAEEYRSDLSPQEACDRLRSVLMLPGDCAPNLDQKYGIAGDFPNGRPGTADIWPEPQGNRTGPRTGSRIFLDVDAGR